MNFTRSTGAVIASVPLWISGTSLFFESLASAKKPAEDNVDAVEIGRGHIVGVQVALGEAENRDVAHRLAALRETHLHGMSTIENDLMRIVLNAPRLEELRHVGRFVRHHRGLWIVGIRTGIVGLGVRIDEREQMTAAQDELIDGVERVVAQAFRMDDDEDVDVLIDRFDRTGVQLAHVE